MFKKLFLIGLFFSLLSGCASHNAIRPPELAFDLSVQEQKVETDGIIMMAKPFYNQTDLLTYFGNDLLLVGIMPIMINIENKSYDGNLKLSFDGLNLIGPDGERSPVVSLDQLFKKTKKSFWRTAGWGVAFGIVGVAVSAINVSNTNKKIRADYESRLLKDGYLRKGNKTEGTVFFAVPPDIKSLDGWKLTVLLKDQNNGKDLITTYKLAGAVLPRPKAEDKYKDEDEEEEEEEVEEVDSEEEE